MLQLDCFFIQQLNIIEGANLKSRCKCCWERYSHFIFNTSNNFILKGGTWGKSFFYDF